MLGFGHISRKILVYGLCCTSLVFSSHVIQQTTATNVVYEVTFQNNTGSEINLSDLKGKVVLINYWAKWCVPCLAEMPALNQLYVDMKANENIVFMAVDMDRDLGKSARFMKKRKYSLPLYQLNSELPADLTTRSIPTTIILDKKGLLVNKHVGTMNFKSTKFKEALQQLSEE